LTYVDLDVNPNINATMNLNADVLVATFPSRSSDLDPADLDPTERLPRVHRSRGSAS
jgi:hypothetical protein